LTLGARNVAKSGDWTLPLLASVVPDARPFGNPRDIGGINARADFCHPQTKVEQIGVDLRFRGARLPSLPQAK
jgi:hypothetical protein